MAIPLSAIRKYTPEIIALSIVAIVLGAFWSIIDTYQPSHLLDLRPDNVSQNAIDLSTVAPIKTTEPIEIELKSEQNESDSSVSNPANENEFAISAQKVIKFALTGESEHFYVFRNFSFQILFLPGRL